MNDYRLPIGTAKKLEMLGTAAGLECVVSFLEALEQFAADGTVPEDVHPFVSVLLADVLPLNDIARKRAEAGREGGSKREANCKRTASKTEANAKQNVSKCEANGKQEREEGERKEVSPTPPLESKEVEEKDSISATVDISNDISPFASCAEPKSSGSTPQDPPVITFPLNDGSEYPISREYFEQLAELYPLLDTMQTLRNIKGWCIANPKYRKTRGGAARFVNNWFSKEQDRGSRTATPTASKPRRPTPEEAYALPAINPWALPGEVGR